MKTKNNKRAHIRALVFCVRARRYYFSARICPSNASSSAPSPRSASIINPSIYTQAPSAARMQALRRLNRSCGTGSSVNGSGGTDCSAAAPLPLRGKSLYVADRRQKIAVAQAPGRASFVSYCRSVKLRWHRSRGSRQSQSLSGHWLFATVPGDNRRRLRRCQPSP